MSGMARAIIVPPRLFPSGGLAGRLDLLFGAFFMVSLIGAFSYEDKAARGQMFRRFQPAKWKRCRGKAS
jgi:hypothetical protein